MRRLVAMVLAEVGSRLIEASCVVYPVWLPEPTPEAAARMAAFRDELVAAAEERNARPVRAVAVETGDETSAGERPADAT